MKEHVDEMAKIIDDNHGFIVSSVETAEALYNAGYRKQSKAEWIISSDGYYPYCSNCKKEPKNGVMTDYCPSCGSYMKGGAE